MIQEGGLCIKTVQFASEITAPFVGTDNSEEMQEITEGNESAQERQDFHADNFDYTDEAYNELDLM